MGTSQDAIQFVTPGLQRWAHRVFTVMGGFMAGAGVLTIHVGAIPRAAREGWTWIVLALAGLLTVGTMSLTNFQLDSDFKWVLLIPSLIWVIGLVLLAVSSLMPGTLHNAGDHDEGHRRGS